MTFSVTEGIHEKITTIAYDVVGNVQLQRFLHECQQSGAIDETLAYATQVKDGWAWSPNGSELSITTNINPYTNIGKNLRVTISSMDQRKLAIASRILESTFGVVGKQASDAGDLYHYHDELNPAVWDGGDIKENVRRKLMAITNEFISFVGVDFDYDDVILTGSSANYNWSAQSDIDLHIVVNMQSLIDEHGPLIEPLLTAQKQLWNEMHNIVIGEHDVEIYVQDSDEEHQSSGVFSLLDNEWLVEPVHEQPEVDDAAVIKKVAELTKKIENVTSHCNKASAVEDVIAKLKKMRQTGLAKNGEFSTENIAFKVLRNRGLIDKLFDCKTKKFDRKLSIEEEEWASLRG